LEDGVGELAVGVGVLVQADNANRLALTRNKDLKFFFISFLTRKIGLVVIGA
jgi:hypothetical protein